MFLLDYRCLLIDNTYKKGTCVKSNTIKNFALSYRIS